MLSIIIPTKNEEMHLPRLLRSITAQRFKDYEIIVADNNSLDRTRKIARKFKCKIVDGGLPGVGRNNGAKVAKGECLLFLDADVFITKNFLEDCLTEFKCRKLDAATCYFRLDDKIFIDQCLLALSNAYLFILQYTKSPGATGSFIMCTKNVFNKLKGFDEELKQTEDHDFAHRVQKIGKFRVLSKQIHFNSRRFDREGRGAIIKKVITSEFRMRLSKGDLEDYDNTWK